jgi:hypothetical protein
LNFNLRRYAKESIERRFLAKAMAMCQDTDYAVRICMCNQLAAISRAVGPDAAEKVGLRGCCSPRHPTQFEPSSPESIVWVRARQTLLSTSPDAFRALVCCDSGGRWYSMTWRAISAWPSYKVVLPELLELVNDEERSVRLSAYQCAVELLAGVYTRQLFSST